MLKYLRVTSHEIYNSEDEKYIGIPGGGISQKHILGLVSLNKL